MSLQKVLAITGKPGLYELKVQTRTGFVAESLLDGKKVTVGLRNNVSLLSEISIYTYDGEVKLAEVFKVIAQKQEGQPALSHKEDGAVLLDFFREVLPNYDEDRVYLSDVKKVVQWYNLLQPKGLVSVEALSAPETESTESAEVETETKDA
jgi:hypothetical protein